MIKPCPFCGSDDIAITKETFKKFSAHRNPKPERFGFYCCNCGLEIRGMYDSEQQAIDAWNKRPREEELLKVIREIVYSGKEPETISSKLDNALILLGKYRGENER